MLCSIVQNGPESVDIGQVLQQASLQAVRPYLSDEDILTACRAAGHRWRNRRYGPVVTVLHFVAQAIGREQSFAATWQNLFTPAVVNLPGLQLEDADDSGLTHARRRLPVEVMQNLAEQACARTRDLGKRGWRRLNLLGLDTTVVSMPDEKPLHQFFGTHRPRGIACRYPLATFASLLSLESSLIRAWRFGPYDPGEIATCLPLLPSIARGDLLLADRRFAGAPFLAKIRQRGAQFLVRKHHRLNVQRLPVLRRLGQNDFITQLTLSPEARKKDPTLPKKLRVRIFRATWTTPAGERLVGWFVTSLLQTHKFPKRTLAKLYHFRWRQETSFLEYKQIFHADVLRSKTVPNIHKEFAAHLLAYQLVRRLIVAAAHQHQIPPTQISFLGAARWTMSFSAAMSVVEPNRLPELFQQLLDCIATCKVDVRPGRVEPRWISREDKHFPKRRISRAQWRARRLGRST
jgi:hypothetical protein